MKTCCDPSLEPSQRDGSNDGSQNLFLWRNVANYPSIISVTPSYVEHCLSNRKCCLSSSQISGTVIMSVLMFSVS